MISIGIVHGGILSTAIDNTFGWLFTALNYPPSFTANLTVNFKKPVMENTEVKIIAKLTEKKGRKMFMSAVMYNTKNEILVESTALFITMQKE
jgi:acyl-coenzyme A thioesterase PaaI-like protein